MASWIRPGDARSDFILGQFQEGRGIADLLHDLRDDWQQPPSKESIAAVSPLAQVQQGNYTTPTFIIHSTADEIVPYEESVAFVEALDKCGISCGLLTVKGAKHIHDLNTEPGSEAWETGVGPGYRFLLKAL